MDFHRYQTIFDGCRAAGIGVEPRETERQWYARSLRSLRSDHAADAEWKWIESRRPYYSVYPLVAESLVKLRLDLDAGLIQLPLPQLLVRFPVGHELDTLGDGTRMARVILASQTSTTHGPGLTLWIGFGETIGTRLRSTIDGFPVYSFRSFALTPGKTIEECLENVDYETTDTTSREYPAVILPCIRLVCTLCLLANDPDMVTPDVLADDRRKYEETGDTKYVDKAHRRGKVGWLVGAKVEIDPHYRRPHFALRWTGEGRRVPKIVPVKGSVVKRHKLTEVPTGFMDDQMDDFVRDAASTRNDWSRSARRHAWQSVIYPRRRADDVGLVIFARDTSGSIDTRLCADFSALISSALADTGCRGLLLDCDCEIQAEYELAPGEEAPLTYQGGGGTSHLPIWARAQELADAGERVAGIVCLTDMYTDFPPDDGGFATLWLATTDIEGPFGRTVRIES